MPERDWDADEKLTDNMLRNFIDQPETIKKWQAALAERRRLAALLSWRPGPPTEPGWHVVHETGERSRYRIVYRFGIGNMPEIQWHLGPLPEPPKAEGANG